MSHHEWGSPLSQLWRTIYSIHPSIPHILSITHYILGTVLRAGLYSKTFSGERGVGLLTRHLYAWRRAPPTSGLCHCKKILVLCWSQFENNWFISVPLFYTWKNWDHRGKVTCPKSEPGSLSLEWGRYLPHWGAVMTKGTKHIICHEYACSSSPTPSSHRQYRDSVLLIFGLNLPCCWFYSMRSFIVQTQSPTLSLWIVFRLFHVLSLAFLDRLWTV